MRSYPRNIATLLLLAVSCWQLPAQDLYPGDVNNNGIVNGADVLYWGIAFGETGPAREAEFQTNDFIPVPFTPWSLTFPNGLNYAYADCNGNGTVDNQDLVQTIRQNFLQVHGVIQDDPFDNLGIPGIDPMLSPNPDQPTASGGQTVTVDFILGSEETPVPDFYGLTFTIRYNPDLLEDGETEFELPDDPWFAGGGGDNFDKLIINDDNTGRIDVAVTRTNQSTVDGFGSMGTFTFVIIEDVVDAIIIDTLFQVEDVLLTDENLFDRAVAMPDNNVAVREIDRTDDIEVFPNPARDLLFIRSSGAPVHQIQLRNALGQSVNTPEWERTHSRQSVLSTDGLPTGLYFLEVWTGPQSVVIKKIVKL